MIELTAEVVSAYASQNRVALTDVPIIVESVFRAFEGRGSPSEEPREAKVPVVPVRASIKPDYLVCIECGRKHKTLKWHLMNGHGMTPEQYRKAMGYPRRTRDRTQLF